MLNQLDEVRFRQFAASRLSQVRTSATVERRLSRSRGCLFGGAIGDALGAPIEFLQRREILETFGDDGLQDLSPAYGLLGAVTDDTQMSLFTAEGLLRAHVRRCLKGIGPVYASITDAAYRRWLNTQSEAMSAHRRAGAAADGWLTSNTALFARRGPGTTCLQAISEKVAWGFPATNTSKGCGGVMRVAPVGIFCAALASERPGHYGDRKTFDLACEIAGLTHGHVTGKLPAGYLAVLITALMQEASWDEAVCRARIQLVSVEGHEQTSKLVDRALDAANSRPAAWNELSTLGQGWVAEEALAISLYCAAGVSRQGDVPTNAVREALLLAVNHDGDSDSTGSITGNMLGALVGCDGLPQEWRETVELNEVINAIAEDLVVFPAWEVGEYLSSEECRYWSKRYPPG